MVGPGNARVVRKSIAFGNAYVRLGYSRTESAVVPGPNVSIRFFAIVVRHFPPAAAAAISRRRFREAPGDSRSPDSRSMDTDRGECAMDADLCNLFSVFTVKYATRAKINF